MTAGCSLQHHSQASLASWWIRSSVGTRYRSAEVFDRFLSGLTIFCVNLEICCIGQYRLVRHQFEELPAKQVASSSDSSNDRESTPAISQELPVRKRSGSVLRSARPQPNEGVAAAMGSSKRSASSEGISRSSSGKRPRERREENLSNGDRSLLTSTSATISSLLNSEENTVTQSLLRQALLPPRKKQRGQHMGAGECFFFEAYVFCYWYYCLASESGKLN